MNSINDNEKIMNFYSKAVEIFIFLETEYAFERQVLELYTEDFRDAYISVKYKGEFVGVEITWYFAGAYISAIFVELDNKDFPQRVSYTDSKGFRGIDIYSLVSFLNKGSNDEFLLKNIDNVFLSKIKKRERIINESMDEVLKNLAFIVKKYESNILQEDLLVFDSVIGYRKMQLHEQLK